MKEFRRLASITSVITCGVLQFADLRASQAAGIRNFKPDIPEVEFKVTDFGAKGDGKTLATKAFTAAINACAKAGGGTVFVPSGTYLMTPFKMASHMALAIAKGAVIQASAKPSDFGLPDPLPATQAEFDALRSAVKPLISGRDLTDVEIRGAGRIDGAGAVWWRGSTERSTRITKLPVCPRPYLVVFEECKRVVISGVTLSSSPKIFIATRRCDEVAIENLEITAPADSPNTVAIAPINTQNMTIRNCVIDVGDDHVAFNSNDGPPTENITVENCTLKHGHGVSVGSDTSGGICNIQVQHCTFESSLFGLRIKSGRDRGGLVENIIFRDIHMRDVETAITINLFYGDKAKMNNPQPEPVSKTTPFVRNIKFLNIAVTHAQYAGDFVGLPESPLKGIDLRDVDISAETKFRIQDAEVKQTDVMVKSASQK